VLNYYFKTQPLRRWCFQTGVVWKGMAKNYDCLPLVVELMVILPWIYEGVLVSP